MELTLQDVEAAETSDVTVSVQLEEVNEAATSEARDQQGTATAVDEGYITSVEGHSHCAPYGAAQRGIKQRNRNGSD